MDELVNAHKLNIGKCDICGGSMVMFSGRQKYCSNTCRSKAYRAKIAGKEREEFSKRDLFSCAPVTAAE